MPEPREQELERRIREALRQIIEKTDRKYDLRLSELVLGKQLHKERRIFLDSAIGEVGESSLLPRLIWVGMQAGQKGRFHSPVNARELRRNISIESS